MYSPKLPYLDFYECWRFLVTRCWQKVFGNDQHSKILWLAFWGDILFKNCDKYIIIHSTLLGWAITDYLHFLFKVNGWFFCDQIPSHSMLPMINFNEKPKCKRLAWIFGYWKECTNGILHGSFIFLFTFQYLIFIGRTGQHKIIFSEFLFFSFDRQDLHLINIFPVFHWNSFSSILILHLILKITINIRTSYAIFKLRN